MNAFLNILSIALFFAPPIWGTILFLKGRLTVRWMAFGFFVNYAILSVLLGYLITWDFSFWGLPISIVFGLVILVSGRLKIDSWNSKGVGW